MDKDRPKNSSWMQRLRQKLRPPVVVALRVSGVIKPSVGPGRGGVSHQSLAPLIKSAFKTRGAVAIALLINSPGGSPVQSKLIVAAIRREAAKSGLPVFAFAEDVAASGGYMIALAADHIYADSSSIVGSIGVISAGFGFQDLIARYGVERRVHTAGESKSQLDPFRRENPDDVRRLEAILGDIHDDFIDLVKTRRGDRLKPKDDVFSGAFWTADGARERGLIDGVGHADEVMRERFGDAVRIRVVEARTPMFQRLLGARAAGIDEPTVDVGRMIAEAETAALWSRYGL